MATGASEAEPFWSDFPRGLRGVKRVISAAREALKAVIGKVRRTTWQRFKVHFLRNAGCFCRSSRL